MTDRRCTGVPPPGTAGKKSVVPPCPKVVSIDPGPLVTGVGIGEGVGAGVGVTVGFGVGF